MMLSERLADYGLTLDEHVVICDRRIVDEAVTSLATLEAENARLRARVAVLEKALQPFAAYLDTAAWDLNNNGDPLPDDHGMGWVYLTVGNFREARAALTPTKENDHAE